MAFINKGRSYATRIVYTKRNVTFKKPGKIYCYLTFRGHHDSVIKRLVKQHVKKERYKISINYNKRPKQSPWPEWNPFAPSLLVYACQSITKCTENQLFQFDGALCERTDGVAVGSPLGPLLASVFMCSI